MTDPGPAPASLPVLLGAAAAFYFVWLNVGTRSNPPISYDKFKAGVTFPFVRELLGFEQDAAYEAGQYMFVSRGTVLGRMHQLKQEQYERYLDGYEEGDEDLPF